jgi:hypothetical protein
MMPTVGSSEFRREYSAAGEPLTLQPDVLWYWLANWDQGLHPKAKIKRRSGFRIFGVKLKCSWEKRTKQSATDVRFAGMMCRYFADLSQLWFTQLQETLSLVSISTEGFGFELATLIVLVRWYQSCEMKTKDQDPPEGLGKELPAPFAVWLRTSSQFMVLLGGAAVLPADCDGLNYCSAAPHTSQ